MTRFASYSSIFQPQLELDAAGNLLDPREGTQVELGLRYVSLDGRLAAQASGYWINDENEAIEDPDVPGGGSFIEGPDSETRGFEILVSGEVLPQFEIITGLSIVDTDRVDDPTPARNFSLYGNYSFGGRFDAFSLGGGLRLASDFDVESDGVEIDSDGYAVVDLFGAYALNDRAELRLNITNLFDNNYIERINTTERGTYFGQPLTATLSVNALF